MTKTISNNPSRNIDIIGVIRPRSIEQQRQFDLHTPTEKAFFQENLFENWGQDLLNNDVQKYDELREMTKIPQHKSARRLLSDLSDMPTQSNYN